MEIKSLPRIVRDFITLVQSRQIVSDSQPVHLFCIEKLGNRE